MVARADQIESIRRTARRILIWLVIGCDIVLEEADQVDNHELWTVARLLKAKLRQSMRRLDG
jgi:hypothetical protein